MKPKTTLKPDAPLTEEPSAEECCVPECGPDTCGSMNTTVVRMNRLNKARNRQNPDDTENVSQVGSEGCCEPDCGPDTCGT